MERYEIDRRFNFHEQTAHTAPLHDEVTELSKGLAVALNEVLPDGREKMLAITKLEEAKMWAHAAIARGPAF